MSSVNPEIPPCPNPVPMNSSYNLRSFIHFGSDVFEGVIVSLAMWGRVRVEIERLEELNMSCNLLQM